MVRHVFLFRLRDDSPDNRRRVVEAIASLRSIEWVQALEVGGDFGGTPLSYSVAAIVSFADEAGLARYQTDPQHRKVVKLLREMGGDVALADIGVGREG